MKTVGIICEYNPFHSGHAYQIETVRQKEPDAAVICLMSGHATQRGELPIADQFTRAAMALSCGADLVLGLPYPYSAASAAYFAGAGVAILDSLGVDELSFGSETADLDKLTQLAALTQAPEFIDGVRARQRAGQGSAAAYFSQLQATLDEDELRPLSNDILALEYVRAIQALNSTMQPSPILRVGSRYGTETIETGKHPSATALRIAISQNNLNDALENVPKHAKEIFENAVKRQQAPVNMARLDAAVLSFFRLHLPEQLSHIAEMQGGLAHRLCTAARESRTLEDMLRRAGAKSYPTARLRRAILYAMTGVTAEDLRTPPGYLMLLGANERGRAIVRVYKEAAPIPIVAKFADAAALSPYAARQAALTLALDALFTLAQPVPCPADTWVKHSPVMI